MTLKKYKKVFAMFAICLVAAVTGVSVGMLFVAQNAPAAAITGTAADYMDSQAQIEALCQKADGGASVESFTAVELFEIAQHKLEQKDSFYTFMSGDVFTTINQKQVTTQLKRDGQFTINKLSPGSVVFGIDTNVTTLTSYDEATGNVTINKDGTFVSTDPIVATYGNAKTETYTAEEYEKKFFKKPTTAVPYIVSSITCGQGDYDQKAKINSDGDYTFTINISGAHLFAAALYYSEDIKASSGSSPRWTSLKMVVTIDKNFNFKQIDYEEKYNVVVMVTASITDVFCQKFFYGDDVPTLEEVLNGNAY